MRQYRSIFVIAGAVMLLAISCGKTESTADIPQNTAETNDQTATPLTPTDQAGTKTFNVTGTNFKFSTTEIRVKQGDKVTINFTNSAGFHDWVVDEFNAGTKQLAPGQSESVTFTASKAGTFEYYCSVADHRRQGMVGKLIVE
jgi:plastocyanin